MQRSLNPGPRVGRGCHTGRSQSVEQEGESGGERRRILGWNRKAISAYTWCVTEKGPQRKWLHKIKKKDTLGCHCHRDQEQSPEQSGEHLVEGCRLLTEARELAGREEMREWRSRHSHNQLRKKKKGPVAHEKEKEEEDNLERFFCHLYEFQNPVPKAPVFVPAELPPRYTISFVPAVSALPVTIVHPVSVPLVSCVMSAVAVSSTDYSVVSSANFVPIASTTPASVSSFPSFCIGPSR